MKNLKRSFKMHKMSFFFSESMHQPKIEIFPKRKIEIFPNLFLDSKKSNIIFPISMERLESNEKKSLYNEQITEVLDFLKKKSDCIERLTVLSTEALNHHQWSAEKIFEVGEYFRGHHKEHILSLGFNYSTWNECLMQNNLVDCVEQYYQKICALSQEESFWYQLMVQVYESSNISNHCSLEHSLTYQRKEYAFICALKKCGYDALIYLGPISPAWAYLYQVFKSEHLTHSHSMKFITHDLEKNKKKLSQNDIRRWFCEHLSNTSDSVHQEKFFQEIQSFLFLNASKKTLKNSQNDQIKLKV